MNNNADSYELEEVTWRRQHKKAMDDVFRLYASLCVMDSLGHVPTRVYST